MLIALTVLVCSCNRQYGTKNETGDREESLANYKRANHYHDLQQTRTAEFYYKKALADKHFQTAHPIEFYETCIELTTLQNNKGDVEGALTVATKGYRVAQKDASDTGQQYAARLLSQIAACQLWLGRTDEAEKNFDRGYATLEKLNDGSLRMLDNMAGTANNIVVECNYANRYQQAEKWTDRMATAVERLTKHPDCPPERADELMARLAANRAIIYTVTGRKQEADKYYRQFLTYHYAQTDNGLLDKATYLESAERWNELADLQERLDSLDRALGVPISMDYLKGNIGLAFTTYMNSGRRDEALRTAKRIVSLLDSVDEYQRKSDAAELATIYETQEKEAKIAEQQATLSRQQSIATAVALVLLLVFFTIYTFHRRRAQQRLAQEHQKLLVAYDQLEETTTAKERIESELRIARDIQMSMVPTQFPQHQSLDLYASMTPAREVGGDLYDFILDNNELYFCVGDVSGKGVPASLFMAQAIRLFRALAKQRLTPADIANRLNAELAADNEQGMFVTMFIGLVDLTTGHLSFCNAGHNPPVFDNRFLQMEPNAPIGLWPTLDYVGEEISDIRGKYFFVYTDGLNEAENPQQEQFGDDRLLSILATETFPSAQACIEHMKRQVEQHRQGADPNDDLTLLCLKVE